MQIRSTIVIITKKLTHRLQRYEENQGGNLTIVQTMDANQKTNHNNNEDYFVMQLQDYKKNTAVITHGSINK